MIRIAVSFAIEPPVPKNTWFKSRGGISAYFAANSAAGGVTVAPNVA